MIQINGTRNYLREIYEVMSLSYHFNAEVSTIIRTERITEDLVERRQQIIAITKLHNNNGNSTTRRSTVIQHLKFLRIVHSRNGLHQVGSRVVAKVRADITNTQASTTGLQILWMLISRLVQCINL